ncbi:MAG: TRM11 family SAM-dependent methyltransferase [bacterium]
MKDDLSGFVKEITTVWSFPERGKWGKHSGKYRGNFAPQIPRNLILKYSEEGDIVLDPMMGGGTTLLEAKLLNRQGIGFDINPEAVKLSKNIIRTEGNYEYQPIIEKGDARYLNVIKDKSIDLVIIHPPYLDIIKYSNGTIKEDLSNYNDVSNFMQEFKKVINECFRVLKENSYCAVLIGDTRKKGHYVPLSYFLMNQFLKQGFVLKEEIIKEQHNCKSTAYWRKQVEKYNFYLIMHEHLFVFRKPYRNEDLKKYKYSIKLANY